MLNPVILRVAKSALLSRFEDKYVLERGSVLTQYPFLKKNGAAFVTLKYNNELRGCIGSVVAHCALYDDIVNNAVSAGFGDPRFEHLHADELSNISVEVSVLSEPTILEYKDFDDLCQKVKPKVDGLILKHGSYHGTFLPQVWEQLATPKLFLQHLSMKAGASPDIYALHPTIYRYGVEAIEGAFNEIVPL
ncbi:AmmeMemoRadiSam system protein A [Candidatus Sulfurimonas baltica]|uniref:AmmeMemoRadiSam system protein A n=1 Tax=Candidatus Sulfurimonas baltica TaxID=2740404 RepID=A0A7S7LWU4_9BACT|nr:AmmeMemoRadiSam system protein A [Candidatus Sulfurimonas baltica]QOY52323.1 AmmeMemoRadiSam system protein A [Candidatus Sulfurimonas baltica]